MAAALLIAPVAACGGAVADRTVNEGTWQTTAGSPTDTEAVVVELVPAPNEFHNFTLSRTQ